MAAIEGPKHAECFLAKIALLTISMDSMQYSGEHCGIIDDMDDEHSV